MLRRPYRHEDIGILKSHKPYLVGTSAKRFRLVVPHGRMYPSTRTRVQREGTILSNASNLVELSATCLKNSF